MDQDRFWSLVDDARSAGGGDCTRQVDLLVEALRDYSPEEILDVGNILEELLEAAYRFDLWGAAYLINGGCSDDGFVYFLGWLITQGRVVYMAALEDPDWLASHPPVASRGARYDPLWCERMLSVADRAYEEVTGHEPPAEPGTEVAAIDGSTGPTGEDWDFDDPEEMRRRYPRLWIRFGREPST